MSKIRSVVIMAGGRGERFWPQSRRLKPKHLLPIVGDKPMLAQTVDRVRDWIPVERIWIITNKEQVDLVRSICPELPPTRIVAEPVGRDTAAAVGLAAMLVEKEFPGTSFAILPSDHVISDSKAFREDLELAFAEAETSRALVTIGIEPKHPATGYGYIQKGETTGNERVSQVRRFVEKPDLPNAQKYLNEGGYFWNAGMFVWTTDAIQAALRQHAPQLWGQLETIRRKWQDASDVEPILVEEYEKVEKISIDYAVMEKADRVLVVEATFAWDDVGEWPAVERHLKPDENGNTISGLSALLGASGNIVRSDQNHLVALIGVDDLMVVHTPDATLVCPKTKAQEIKHLLREIEKHPDGERFL